MRVPGTIALVIRATLVSLALAAPLAAAAQEPAPACASFVECRQAALDAAAREDYETFHTFAWRAVQTGKSNDATSMSLLARAQSLSGRPHDALVMLRRLAERGTAVVEAETSDDFRRVRALPGWPEVLERIRGVAAGNEAPAPEPAKAIEVPSAAPAAKSPAPPRAETPSPAASEPATEADSADEETIAVPATLARPVALDHDAVSRRFVFADDSSETLKIVDELSKNAVNLVSRGWAGPYRSVALAIDPQRGDLWVAGTDLAGAEPRSAVHRVQLISGRLLYTVALPDEAGPARFADLAMSGGAAFLLDEQGRRVYQLALGSKTLRLQATIETDAALASVAPAADAVLYVAHDEGIIRLGPDAKTQSAVTAARGVDLRGLQWIRAHQGTLLGIQMRPDGTRSAVRIRLDRRGRRATSLQVLGEASSRAAAIAGGVFYYLGASPDAAMVLRRVTLK